MALDLWTSVKTTSEMTDNADSTSDGFININSDLELLCSVISEPVHNIPQIRNENSNKIIVDYNFFISNTLNSFSSDYGRIISQIYADLPRIIVYYNHEKKSFKSQESIRTFIDTVKNDNFGYEKLLLCNQVNFAMFFELLYKKYSGDKLEGTNSKYHVGMLNTSGSGELPSLINNQLLISFFKDKYDGILIKKKLRIFTKTNRTVAIINAKININLDEKQIMFSWALSNEIA